MLAVTTHRTVFTNSGTTDTYVYPPGHLATASIVKATATIQGTVAAASADSITVKGLNASSAFSTTIATGLVTNAATYQIVSLTVSAANAAASRQTQAKPVKVTIPNCGAITPNVDIQITWDGTGPTSGV